MNWHRPQPGPDYWDWRCMVCDQPVADHPSAWRRFRRRILGWLGQDASKH